MVLLIDRGFSIRYLYPRKMRGCHAILGENQKALRFLSEAQRYGFAAGYQYYIEFYAPFENLRDDPEFKAIVKKAQEASADIRVKVIEMEDEGELNL